VYNYPTATKQMTCISRQIIVRNAFLASDRDTRYLTVQCCTDQWDQLCLHLVYLLILGRSRDTDGCAGLRDEWRGARDWNAGKQRRGWAHVQLKKPPTCAMCSLRRYKIRPNPLHRDGLADPSVNNQKTDAPLYHFN